MKKIEMKWAAASRDLALKPTILAQVNKGFTMGYSSAIGETCKFLREIGKEDAIVQYKEFMGYEV